MNISNSAGNIQQQEKKSGASVSLSASRRFYPVAPPIFSPWDVPQGRGGRRELSDSAGRRHTEELQEEVGAEGVVSHPEAAVSDPP